MEVASRYCASTRRMLSQSSRSKFQRPSLPANWFSMGPSLRTWEPAKTEVLNTRIVFMFKNGSTIIKERRFHTQGPEIDIALAPMVYFIIDEIQDAGLYRSLVLAK